MRSVKRLVGAIGVVVSVVSSAIAAGGSGFANKPGGGPDDPVIVIAASKVVDVANPFELGQIVSRTEPQANGSYRFDATSDRFGVTDLPPTLPPTAAGRNQFIRITFPFAIHAAKARKSLVRVKAQYAATSYLTPNLEITDQNGQHIAGIPIINGRDPFNMKVFNTVGFPQWLDSNGKNVLVGKNQFVYVASLPTDTELQSIAAFGGTPGDPQTVAPTIDEIRIRLHKVKNITVNGFWVLKVGDANGLPRAPGTLTVTSIQAKTPLSPAQTTPAGLELVQSYSRYVVTFSEPVVPRSVGMSAAFANEFNAQNPPIPWLYSGNLNIVPNPDNLLVPLSPNFAVSTSPNAITSFNIPFDVRPINPNNFSQFVVEPLLDLQGDVDVTLTALRISQNQAPTNDVANPVSSSAPTTLYDVPFDDAASASKSFHTSGSQAFVNAPVSPQAIYFTPLSGTGFGVLNLDGSGYETNDPSTSKVLLLTNLFWATSCSTGVTLPGSALFGCNPNTFGDPGQIGGTPVLPTSPIGLGGNPVGHLGGPTPLAGVNEGSTGSTASGGNPKSLFPSGFETVVRNSKGDARLIRAPVIGSVGDVAIGDFLDTLFFDTQNPFAASALHQSVVNGTATNRNSISDPPVPNPPPLQMAVGLPAVDVAFNKVGLLKPAFVIEGAEVFPAPGALPGRLHLIHEPAASAGAGDRLPTFPHSGPQAASFTAGGAPFASRQQIGNFLYVTDRDSGKVVVLNSNTFGVVDSIKLPDPEGLALSPDLRRLYVSNYGDDTVSIVGTDPYGPFFHDEINRVKTANGPRAIVVQEDGEDVFVCNTLANAVSILSPKTQSFRKVIKDQGLKKPWKVVLTPRQLLTGWTSGIYFGFLIGQQSSQVLVYESGPGGPTGYGLDDIRWIAEGQYSNMRGACYDPGTYPGSQVGLQTGLYVTHRDAQTGLGMVTRIAFVNQLPLPGPIPVGLGTLPSNPQTPLGNITFRVFQPVGTWGGPLVPLAQKLNFAGTDQQPFDVALADFRTQDFFSTNPLVTPTNFGSLTGLQSTIAVSLNNRSHLRIVQGAPISVNYADRMYVSFPGDDRIEVLDANSAGIRVNAITGVPKAGALTTFWD
ncbi:MAG: YncE family protein [Planctomycetes bacterium]|nr:YncE family protein [Planctomycetota bacterium]